MVKNKNEAIEFVNENDVKFIRLQFCDIFGSLKNISIMSSQLERAFETGISFDASSVKGFLNENESDLLLYPDASTMSVLPWRPQQGRVVRFFCDVKKPDGTLFDGDCRKILKDTNDILKNKKYDIHIGPECEFFLFKTDEEGNPVPAVYDNASYFDISPLDKGENIRREICITLEEMGLEIESSHHETGASQHEISFKYADALHSADNLTTFKTVVKTSALKNGLFASFMPKPLNNTSGSGLHINISVWKDGKNIFDRAKSNTLSNEAQSFIAGVLTHIKGICAFTNPTVNSYKRIGAGFEAPREINWSYKNRSQLIRIPASVGTYSRMELRNPDPTCNPYLAFSLIARAGIEGIEKKLKLQEAESFTETLPSSLDAALEEAKKDSFIKDVIGEHIFDKYIEEKALEYRSYSLTVHKWETDHYFNKF